MKKFLCSVFICFLFVYTLFILSHIRQIAWTRATTLLFLGGLSIALLAHAKRNYFTVILLVIHMVIEWFEWSQETFVLRKYLLGVLHALMDFTFLSHEVNVHLKKHQRVVITGVIVTLLSIFCFGRSMKINIETIEEVEPFVIGGVLGCVVSHIYFHLKKE
jgi:glucose-6-phosphate-specific signal transduction histidine kinase